MLTAKPLTNDVPPCSITDVLAVSNTISEARDALQRLFVISSVGGVT